MATKEKKREKRRAARLRTKARHDPQDVEEVIDELEDGEEEATEEEEPVTKELIKKDYYGDPSPMQMPMMGPTSWDEYDALEVAREQAKAVDEVTWTVRQLVDNIVYAPMMTPDEKSKAIKAVGDGYGAKLKEAQTEAQTESKSLKKEYNLDLLEVEALIAKDLRHSTIPDRVSDWISKAKLTTAAENSLSDAQFAFVVTRDGKKIRKYPIHDKAHVRNALARAAQQIKAGGAGAADAKAALPKIHAAAKKMGIGTMEKSIGSVIVQKDASGEWRAVMYPSNNFIDFDGDIISESAHEEYVDWVNQNMDLAPVFLSWHEPGTMRKSRVDFVDYENGFLLMSAPLLEKEAAGLFRAQIHGDIGMSHAAFPLEFDAADPRVVTKYRMVEVSDLPSKWAANPFTEFVTTLSKEADMSKAVDKKAYLAEILGSVEEAEKFLNRTGVKQKALQDAGVESKEKDAEKPVVAKAQASVPEAVNMEAVTAQVFEHITKELDIDGLNDYLSGLQASSEKVAVLEALVKDLTQSADDRLAEKLEAPVGKTLVWQKARASQSKDTLLKEDDETDKILKKAKPVLGWLSEATGTTPVQS